MDKDLKSIASARRTMERAWEAYNKFLGTDPAHIDAIVMAMARAIEPECERLAVLAVEETGYGNVPDKRVKNLFNALSVADYLREITTALGSPPLRNDRIGLHVILDTEFHRIRRLHHSGPVDANPAWRDDQQFKFRHLHAALHRHHLRALVGTDRRGRDPDRVCRCGGDEELDPCRDHSWHG